VSPGEDRTALRKFVHDARTPVTVVTGFADLLLRSRDTMSEEQVRDALQRIADGATQLRSLLDDLDASAGVRGARP
jgi:K+-sensing histidine kinase KdpD